MGAETADAGEERRKNRVLTRLQSFQLLTRADGGHGRPAPHTREG